MREPSVGLDEPILPPKKEAVQQPSAPQGEASQPAAPKKQKTPLFTVTFWSLFIFFVTTICGAVGFFVGDTFGRQHAQLNNPALRAHYTGQCMQQLTTEMRKEIRKGFGKDPDLLVSKSEQDLTREVQSIRSNLESIKQVLLNGKVEGQASGTTAARLNKLLDLMESRHVELVSDRCPASPKLPRTYSSQG